MSHAAEGDRAAESEAGFVVLRRPALPIREMFYSNQFRWLPDESCMDAPLWLPVGSCYRAVSLSVRLISSMQSFVRRREWMD